MQHRPIRGASAANLDTPYPPWQPVLAYNNLSPVRCKQLTTPAVETQCELAAEALDALREATGKLTDPLSLFQTVALVEAQASSAIEGIVTSVDEMLKYLGTSRLSNGEDPDTDDALRHHGAIIDAWQRHGAQPIGTAMATRACSTTKGRRMPVLHGRGTVIAGPRGIIFDWGAISLGNDLLGHQIRALTRWADDHPSALAQRTARRRERTVRHRAARDRRPARTHGEDGRIPRRIPGRLA